MTRNIIFKDIEKSFNNVKVLKKLNLEMKEGEILGLIGRSGCGKSTLLKILLGFLKADKGRIEYDSQNITNNANKLKKIVGYCTQENSFYQELTVEENLRYFARMYGLTKKATEERIEELLELVGMRTARKRIAERISGGMKRRLDFAIALVHNPEILVLDEPTTGLDPVLREKIFQLMKNIKEKGKTIILISHHLSYMQRYCTKIAIMDQGRIIELFNPNKIPKRLSVNNSLEEIFENLFNIKENKDNKKKDDKEDE